MRTLPESVRSALECRARDLCWYIEADFPDGTWRAAQRGTILKGEACPRGLDAVQWENLASGREWLFASRAQVRIARRSAGAPLCAPAEEWGLEGRAARLGIILAGYGPDGSAGSCILGDYVILSAKYSLQFIDLTLMDALSARGDRPLLRTRGGDPLPVLFGRVEDCPLRPMQPLSFAGQRLFLTEDLSPDAVQLRLNRADVLPESGRVQTGDEVLDYRERDSAGGTLGSASSPLQRPRPAFHSAGTEVRLIPEGGLRYLAADQEGVQVREIRADGVSVPGDAAKVTFEALDGRTACFVTLDAFPCIIRHASAESILRCDGAVLPGLWSMGAENTALYPWLAADEHPLVTAARVFPGSGVLHLAWMPDLSGMERRLGRLAGAALEIRYAATAAVAAPGPASVEVRLNGAIRGMSLSWPPRDTRVAHMPERVFVAGMPPEEVLLPGQEVALPTAFLTVTVDLSDLPGLMDDGSGWGAFAPDTLEVLVRHEGLEGEILISDIALVIRYHSRTGAVLADNLTATVECLNDAGLPARNPVDALRRLLCHGSMFALPPEALDEASFDEQSARLEASGAVFDRRYARARTLEGTLGDILKDAGLRLAAGGVFRLRGPVWAPARPGGEITAEDAWDSRRLLLPGPPEWRREEGGDILMTFPAPLDALLPAPADRMALEGMVPEWDLALGEWEGAALREPDVLTAHLRIVLAGRFVWRHDAATFILRLWNSGALVFVVNGRTAARLEPSGYLEIAGMLSEEVLPPLPMSGIVGYDAGTGRVLFGAGPQGGERAALSLDDAGNIRLRGRLTEEAFPPEAGCPERLCAMEWGGVHYTALSPVGGQAVMWIGDEAGDLFLRGSLTERSFMGKE